MCSLRRYRQGDVTEPQTKWKQGYLVTADPSPERLARPISCMLSPPLGAAQSFPPSGKERAGEDAASHWGPFSEGAQDTNLWVRRDKVSRQQTLLSSFCPHLPRHLFPFSLGFWGQKGLLGLSVGNAAHCHLFLHHLPENVSGWAGWTTAVLTLQR